MSVSEKVYIHIMKSLATKNAEAARFLLQSHDINFDNFSDFLSRHQLREIFYSLFALSSLGDAVPTDFISPLRDRSCQQKERSLLLMRHLSEIRESFKREAVDFILLKGIYFAERFGGDLGQRFIHDLDILTRKEDVPQALSVLAGMGFKRKRNTPVPQRFILKYTHAIELVRDNIELDLHWVLRNRPAYKINYGTLWNDIIEFELNGTRYKVLSDEFTILLLILSIAHDLERGHCKAKHFFDLFFILRTQRGKNDWDLFFENRRREKLFKMSLNLLALFLSFFDCHDEFPDLEEAVWSRSGSLELRGSHMALNLIGRPPQSLRNRLWFCRLYPTPALIYWGWWVASLPIRYVLGNKI